MYLQHLNYCRLLKQTYHSNISKSKVIGRCGGDEKKTNDNAEPTKVER